MKCIEFVTYASTEDFDEREDLMEYFMELDSEIAEYKWKLAKLWMLGEVRDLTADEQLMVAGLF